MIVMELSRLLSYIMHVAVAVGYGVIAVQFWRQSKTHSEARSSLRMLVAIFLLCSFNGYILHILGFHADSWVHAVSVLPLVIIAWRFALKQEVLRIVDALERDAHREAKVVLQKVKDKSDA